MVMEKPTGKEFILECFWVLIGNFLPKQNKDEIYVRWVLGNAIIDGGFNYEFDQAGG